MTSLTSSPLDHELELHVRRISIGSPVWAVAVHASMDAGIDDTPLRATRVVHCSPVSFNEHWCGAGGLRFGAGASGRIPAPFRTEILAWLEEEFPGSDLDAPNGV